jgi:hypothetical protein
VILSFHISLIAGSKLSFEVSATCYGMWRCIIRRLYNNVYRVTWCFHHQGRWMRIIQIVIFIVTLNLAYLSL